MLSNCPSCQESELVASELQQGLPAHTCRSCHGSLLLLQNYRSWRATLEGAKVDASPDRADQAQATSESQGLLRCPSCRGFMTKYRFSSDTKNQVDLCAQCDAVWLDRGEWILVEHLARAGLLTRVFEAGWQAKLRQEEVRRRAEERWKVQLGDDYERAREIRNWLAGRDKSKELMAYLFLAQTEGPV